MYGNRQAERERQACGDVGVEAAEIPPEHTTSRRGRPEQGRSEAERPAACDDQGSGDSRGEDPVVGQRQRADEQAEIDRLEQCPP
jgi:hypothetical protein